MWRKKLDDKIREKLQQKATQFRTRIEEARKIKEEETRIENERIRIAKQRYLDWREKYKIQSEKSAGIIWNWYQELVASEDFQEIVTAIKKVCDNPGVRISLRISLRISKIIKCLVVPYNWTEKQFLGISISDGKLFVHDCGKYGKSHAINGTRDLLEHVMPPILIEIAETITNGTIWDIIDIY